MRMVLAILAAVVLAIGPASAQVILFEDWETGTDGWTDVGNGPFATLDNTQNTTPGGTWSLKTANNATTNYTNAKDYSWATESPKRWVVTWNFMHQSTTTREYLQIRSFRGGGGSGTLQQLISLGVYNASPANQNMYNFRVAVGSVNWDNTTIRRQANVWHSMKVEQFLDGTINFWIDGQLGATATTTAVYGITQIRVGSALTNNNAGAWFDDIKVEIVPEPGSLVAFGTGLISLLGVARRRR
ncbi:MAG: PEP-CTERM sorting domain-containing protein [Armatimonadota bacterium]